MFFTHFLFALLALAGFSSAAPIMASHKGKAMVYVPDPQVPDACGKTHTQDDYVVTLSSTYFNNSHGTTMTGRNALCDREIHISYRGLSTKATIVGVCTDDCAEHDIRITQAVLRKIGPKVSTVQPNEPRLDVRWLLLELYLHSLGRQTRQGYAAEYCRLLNYSYLAQLCVFIIVDDSSQKESKALFIRCPGAVIIRLYICKMPRT
ncbi:hypothetical protein BC835DRAFT_535396 [Cytidiella melzeri]|nr:hypothetical protein BC835DRAFT_535396 [Cytidiella melzeri]